MGQWGTLVYVFGGSCLVFRLSLFVFSRHEAAHAARIPQPPPPLPEGMLPHPGPP